MGQIQGGFWIHRIDQPRLHPSSRTTATKGYGDMTKYLAIGLTCLATPVFAGIELQFYEGAPKDRFEIRNISPCTLDDKTVTIDLTASNGGLIFDVTGEGAGVEVFQPLELVAGSERLVQKPLVKDGDTTMALDITKLERGETIAFTIDVDDTAGQREITVNGSELAGATLQIGDDTPVVLDNTNRVTALNPTCSS